jgi:hypothetical protein
MLAPVERDDGDELSFTPPHERTLARSLGWTGADGRWPFAPWRAAAHGIEPGARAWGLMTPVHWHVGADQVRLTDPAELQLDAAASRALLDAVGELFTSEGFGVEYASPLAWYLAHDSLDGLRTASLDRVIGRNVDPWLTDDAAVRLVRRLQNEVQMLLYTHPLNERREAQGLLPVNSFWLSGCGRAQPVVGALPQIDDRLRGPALAGDWSAWADAWASLDAGPVAALHAGASRGDAVRLTLCGERSSLTLAPAGGGWRRFLSFTRRARPADLLETL